MNKRTAIQLGQTRSPALPIKYDDFKEIFEVDLSCPSGLRWKSSENVQRKRRGEPAGCLNGKGYYKVKVRGISYRAHRVVYCLANQVHFINQNLVIDHIDMNRMNNAPGNLRLVSQYENAKNRKDSLKGSYASPYPYVRWSKKDGKWIGSFPAVMTIDGKRKSIGSFTDSLLAFMVLLGEFRVRNIMPNDTILSAMKCHITADDESDCEVAFFDRCDASD